MSAKSRYRLGSVSFRAFYQYQGRWPTTGRPLELVVDFADRERRLPIAEIRRVA
jgi:hypothetical protein